MYPGIYGTLDWRCDYFIFDEKRYDKLNPGECHHNGEISFGSVIDEIYKEFERYVNDKVKEEVKHDLD